MPVWRVEPLAGRHPSVADARSRLVASERTLIACAALRSRPVKLLPIAFRFELFRFGALNLIFFLSGAIALVYEVIWQRKFSLLFGSSAPATAAVLVGYFAGLGLGSFVFGKSAHRWASPIRVYGWLEILVGFGALAVHPILNVYAASYPGVIVRLEDSPAALLAAKGVLGLFAILLPTFAMGGTLPVISRTLNAEPSTVGRKVGLLYAVNTFGAALGAFTFPLILLPRFGLNNLTLICAASNLAIGVIALLLARGPHLGRPEIGRSAAVPRICLSLSFISGLAGFALQVLWNRAFAQVHDNSVQAFAWITGIFILAVAAGSQLASLFLKWPKPAMKLGVAWLIGGILTAIAPVIFVRETHNLRFTLPGENFLGLNSTLLLTAALLLFLPIMLLSSGFPILVQEASSETNRSAAQVTGSLLVANTIGCISGALLAGFVLPQLLGLWRSISIAGILFAGIGIRTLLSRQLQTLFAWSFDSRQFISLLVPAALLIVIFRTGAPRTFLLASDSLVALKEGPYGIAAVIQRSDGSRRLKLNNHYVLGGTLSIGDQRMQAHIPLILAGHGGRALFLGYGTGITAGGALFHPEFEARAVELVPEVADLAAKFFGEANGNFAASERLVLDDARNFLRGTTEKFDVIVGDLVVPWRPGESALYTIEHFRAAQNALSETGLFCAWIPMFQLRKEEFQIIVTTFLKVFGQAYLWRGDFSPHQPAYGLIAFKRKEQSLNPVAIQAALAQMRLDPQNPQLQAATAFWMHFVGQLTPAYAGLSVAPFNSENTPWLELSRSGQDPASENNRYFVGRSLQSWENGVREAATDLAQNFPAEARLGFSAGRGLVEFAQLLAEHREQEAAQVRKRLQATVGQDISRLIFEK